MESVIQYNTVVYYKSTTNALKEFILLISWVMHMKQQGEL